MAELLVLRPFSIKKERGEVQFKLNEMLKISEYFGKTMDDIFFTQKGQNGALEDKEA